MTPVLFFQTFRSWHLAAQCYSVCVEVIIRPHQLPMNMMLYHFVFYAFASDENVTGPLSENEWRGRDAREGYAKWLRRSSTNRSHAHSLLPVGFCSSVQVYP